MDDKDEASDEDEEEDEPQPAPSSPVDHPSHYRKDSGYEAIDVIEAWELDFCLGNALKYICRAGLKQDAVEDLEKAEWYLRREIERRKAAVDSTYK